MGTAVQNVSLALLEARLTTTPPISQLLGSLGRVQFMLPLAWSRSTVCIWLANVFWWLGCAPPDSDISVTLDDHEHANYSDNPRHSMNSVHHRYHGRLL